MLVKDVYVMELIITANLPINFNNADVIHSNLQNFNVHELTKHNQFDTGIVTCVGFYRISG